MKNANMELAKAMLIASHDYGFYRMNRTVMQWLKAKDSILASKQASAVWKDAAHIRKQSYYQDIVNMAESRPLHRIN